MPKLDNWSCGPVIDDPYLAPERAGLCLHGTVTGHHRIPDGETIRTNRVAKVNGRTVVTESGTVYELGNPDPEYLAWMAQHNIPFDPDFPIRVRSGAPN